MKNLKVGKPHLTFRDALKVFLAVKSGWITSNGKYSNLATKELQRIFGRTYVSLCSNGTTALHLSLLAMDIRKGDEVIVPNLTYISVPNSVIYCGADVVICDINFQDFSLSIESAAALISERTKAIIAVHNYGIKTDLTRLREFCDKHSLFLIEDCAEAAFFQSMSEMKINYGHVSTFSFYGNKIISSGEGGAVLTDNKDLYQRVEFLKNQGNLAERRFYFPEIGYNFRFTNLPAALLVSQLKRLAYELRARYRIYKKYFQYLKDCEGIGVFPHLNNIFSPWLFPILVKDMDKRDELIAFLEEKKIETRPFFYPISQNPRFKNCKRHPNLANSELISKLGVNLPTYTGLKNREIKYISQKINEFYSKIAL